MKYPKIHKNPQRIVSIPSLSGGMNLRDSLNLCNDNQLTDSLNMWFRDGVLKTRAGLSNLKEDFFSISSPSVYDNAKTEFKCHNEIIKTDSNGKIQKLISVKIQFLKNNSGKESPCGYTLKFFWCGENSFNPLPEISFTDTLSQNDGFTGINYFLFQYSGVLYCFIKSGTNKNDTDMKSLVKTEIKALGENAASWIEPEPYVPLVMTHCKTDGSIAMSVDEIVDNGGVFWEAFNLLSDKYRMVYSTVNKKLFDEYISQHDMRYSLCYNAGHFIGATVTAKLTTNSKTYTHSVKITTVGYNRETTSEDGLYMSVQGSRLEFYTDPECKNIAKVESHFYVPDDLEIIAPCPCLKDNLDRIFDMTECKWFGGASSGINGGTRLFLGGNPKEKSLMLWSGADNPLYFPENAYSYVGSSESKITTFGKQEDMLLVFKENEFFYTKYHSSTDILNTGLSSRKINNYKISKVNFSLNQIHSDMGCNCPDTVELCRNRLIWTNRNGKVYTLTNDGQYTELNIFSVSEMIGAKLKTENLKDSYSADWDGYYMLFCDNKIYLMDYNSYGYQYISSYSKTEDANIRIPWYYWEIDNKGGKFMTLDDSLCCVKAEFNDNLLNFSLSKLSGDKDFGEPINSSVMTKFFDFGEPNRRKNIKSVGITFGNNGGCPITVNYITESGEDRETAVLTSNETESRSARYIVSRVLSPSIRSAVRFGIKLSCDDIMAIEGINISYELLNLAR